MLRAIRSPHLVGLFALALALTGLAAPKARGEVPQTLDYQGFLSDASGVPLGGAGTGPVDVEMRLEIYDRETEGNLLWSETQTTPVVDGVFNVRIGRDPIGNPFPWDLFDGERFLQVSARELGEPSFETLEPRQPFASVAFAQRAAVADATRPRAITTQMLQSLAVTGAKIGQGEVSAFHFAPQSVGPSALRDDSIGADDLAPGAVETSELADEAVTTEKIAVRPSVKVTRSTPQPLSADAHFEWIVFDSELWDTSDMHTTQGLPASGARLTAREPGLYLVTANLGFGNTDLRREVRMIHLPAGGSGSRAIARTFSEARAVSLSTVHLFEARDWVHIEVDTTIDEELSGVIRPTFSMTWIAPAP